MTDFLYAVIRARNGDWRERIRPLRLRQGRSQVHKFGKILQPRYLKDGVTTVTG
jgi:hypothetical protein